MYESQVTFTFDTTCPWTYLGRKRLDQALAQVRDGASASQVSFTVVFAPYQMDPSLPDAVDKRAHHLEAKHFGNADAQRVYQEHMQSLFAPLGLTLRFDGQNGNTLRAHRVIQRVQDDRGADAASALVDALFRRYFTEAQHPAAQDTLVGACVEVGLSEDEARALAEDDETGDREVRQKIRTVAIDVDAVPMVTFEGRRRDITLTGAKEVSVYVKAMETIIKEST